MTWCYLWWFSIDFWDAYGSLWDHLHHLYSNKNDWFTEIYRPRSAEEKTDASDKVMTMSGTALP
jgi:hypothetical protein